MDEMYQKFTISKQESLRLSIALEGFLREETGEETRATYREYLRRRLQPAAAVLIEADDAAGLGRLAAERGLGVQSHLSENLDEVAWVRELCPDCGRYWESYAKFGLWEGSVMAHCVHCDDRERAALREGRVLAVHCADSNTNLCSGVAPVRRLLEEGVQVALGSDMAGGGQLSMWDVAAMSIRVSKQRTIHDPERPAFLTAAEAYYLGTSAGHRYFGAGPGFAPGDPLHAVVVDDRGFPPTPRELTLPERLERALYLTRKEHIRAVYSEGRRVLAAPL